MGYDLETVSQGNQQDLIAMVEDLLLAKDTKLKVAAEGTTVEKRVTLR